MLQNLNRYKLIPFVQYSKLWLLISALAIIGGVIIMVGNYRTMGNPLFLGIDFTGGSLIQLQLQEPGNAAEIAEIAQKYSVGEAMVQLRRGHQREVEIRVRIDTSSAKDTATRSELRAEKISEMEREIGDKYGGSENMQVLQQDYVGPVVGAELIRNAIIALIIGTIAIMVYIFIRFNRLVFAIAAVVALIHDVIIALSGTALLKLEVNSFFIAVVLTIIGYSINDTIIIYDRIRENLRNFPQINFPTIINLSLTQTLTRSLATVATVVIMLIALLLFGGRALYGFSMAMLFGMISGAYSSVFIAAPIVLYFTREERKYRLPKYVDLVAAHEQVATGEFDEDEAEIYEEKEKEMVLAPKDERKPGAGRTAREPVSKADDEEGRREAADKIKKKKKKLRRR
jgi:preprotein translocase subunit SecF